MIESQNAKCMSLPEGYIYIDQRTPYPFAIINLLFSVVETFLRVRPHYTECPCRKSATRHIYIYINNMYLSLFLYIYMEIVKMVILSLLFVRQNDTANRMKIKKSRHYFDAKVMPSIN